MALIERVREYLRGCPLLAGERLAVDYLGNTAGSYSVDVVPGQEVVKRYIDGSCVKQLLFVLSGRASYGGEAGQNADNLRFYEELSAWLEREARAGRLPDLGEGRQAQKVEALTGGYVMDTQAGTARYQIQCRLTYKQGGVR